MRAKLVIRSLNPGLVEEVILEGDLGEGLTVEDAIARLRDAREVVIEPVEEGGALRRALAGSKRKTA